MILDRVAPCAADVVLLDPCVVVWCGKASKWVFVASKTGMHEKRERKRKHA